MELKELVEKIVGREGSVAVETLMADIDDWPAWYYELFEGERNYDFSGRVPTASQKLDIATLSKAVGPVVERDKSDMVRRGRKFNAPVIAQRIAQRVVYWADWYGDVERSWDIKVESEEQQAHEAAYLSDYGYEENRYEYGTE